MKKSIRKIIATTVVGFQIFTANQIVMAQPIQTRITKEDVGMLDNKEIKEATRIICVPAKSEVNILEIIDEEYVLVQYGKEKGYILRKSLKYPIKYAKAFLNLRSAPENGQVICIMPIGAKLSILESENGWAKVMYEGTSGYCSEDYLTNEHIIGYYSTVLSKNSNNVNNIQVASNFINGKIIKEGQTFSFSNAIGGESTAELGYKEAPVYIGKDKKVDGMGGGVCQVSSTLYAAIMSIQDSAQVIEINERHPHNGGSVSYISKELEATIWYPTKDLKFTPKCDIKIEAYLENGRLYVNVIKL